MTPAQIEAARRARRADVWYGCGIVLAGAPLLAMVLLGWMGVS